MYSVIGETQKTSIFNKVASNDISSMSPILKSFECSVLKKMKCLLECNVNYACTSALLKSGQCFILNQNASSFFVMSNDSSMNLNQLYTKKGYIGYFIKIYIY